MDQNENIEIRTQDTVKAVIILGTLTASALFGTYQIGKLGYEFGVEIVRSRKEKKNSKKDN